MDEKTLETMSQVFNINIQLLYLIGGYDGLIGLKCLNCGHEYLTKACNI